MKKKIFLYIGVTVAGVILFYITHLISNEWRGYVSYGGELLFLLAPVVFYLLRVCIRDFKNLLRKENQK